MILPSLEVNLQSFFPHKKYWERDQEKAGQDSGQVSGVTNSVLYRQELLTTMFLCLVVLLEIDQTWWISRFKRILVTQTTNVSCCSRVLMTSFEPSWFQIHRILRLHATSGFFNNMCLIDMDRFISFAS